MNYDCLYNVQLANIFKQTYLYQNNIVTDIKREKPTHHIQNKN